MLNLISIYLPVNRLKMYQVLLHVKGKLNLSVPVSNATHNYKVLESKQWLDLPCIMLL